MVELLWPDHFLSWVRRGLGYNDPMERAAKERLIGAIVLVSAAWLLIPVFLDQSADAPVGEIRRELALPERADAQQGAAPLRRETISLRENTRDPILQNAAPAAVTALPAPEVSVADTPAQTNAAVPDDPAAASASSANEPAAEESPAEAETPSTAAEATARAAAALQPVTESAEVQTPPVAEEASARAAAATGQLWAVQLGSFSDKDNAQRLAASLRSEGLPAFISEVTSDNRVLHRVRVGPQSDRAASEAVMAQLAADGHSSRVVPHP